MMSKHLTRLTACSALLAAAAWAGGAFAGEEIYIATVCDDTGVLGTTSNPCNAGIGIYSGALADFYLSGKEYQFTHYNTDNAYKPVPTVNGNTFANGEWFKASGPITNTDPCLVNPASDLYPGPNATGTNIVNKAARVPYKNAGTYEWTVVLPKKPESNLNIAIQCAVLKPQETDITYCAAEAGEFQGPGRCNQAVLNPGQPTIASALLPRITAVAYPGLYTRTFNPWAPFNLTAYRAPSTVGFTADPATGALTNSVSMQALDGSALARIPLKACLTETIYVKQPVTGQVNALGQTESDLEAGDYFVVRMDVQRGHPMDIYCNAQSIRVQGIGDPITLLP